MLGRAQVLALVLVPGACAVARVPGQVPRRAALREQRRRALCAHGWVVSTEARPARPAALLDYLSRYTQSTVNGAECILTIRNDKMLPHARADAHGGKRVIAIDDVQFIARLLQHMLPARVKRSRHYGLLASAAKAERLALARTVLACYIPMRAPLRDARALMRRVTTIDIACMGPP